MDALFWLVLGGLAGLFGCAALWHKLAHGPLEERVKKLEGRVERLARPEECAPRPRRTMWDR